MTNDNFVLLNALNTEYFFFQHIKNSLPNFFWSFLPTVVKSIIKFNTLYVVRCVVSGLVTCLFTNPLPDPSIWARTYPLKIHSLLGLKGRNSSRARMRTTMGGTKFQLCPLCRHFPPGEFPSLLRKYIHPIGELVQFSIVICHVALGKGKSNCCVNLSLMSCFIVFFFCLIK